MPGLSPRLAAAALFALVQLRCHCALLRGPAVDDELPGGLSLQLQAFDHVKAWFDVVEDNIGFERLEYWRVPSCSPEEVPYINVVVHISRGNWTLHCGNLSRGDRGPALKEVLDVVVPDLPPTVNVYVPFGLHDGAKLRGHVPVLAEMHHPLHSAGAVPFAMGLYRSHTEYFNLPVVGWNRYVKRWLTCNRTRPSIQRAVFRGRAVDNSMKYGTCEKACSWEDNGRLFLHKRGEERPDLLDVWVSNVDKFRSRGLSVGVSNLMQGGSKMKFLPLPEQLCNYQAIVNVGANADWAGRLRQSFYGNAVVMLPENPPSEFFTSFMQPWKDFWPIKSDLGDIIEQVSTVLSLANLTEQLQAQKNFTSLYLTEEFMHFYNKLVILEYDRRVRSSSQPPRQLAMKTGSKPGRLRANLSHQAGERRSAAAAADEARGMLKLTGCRVFSKRACPGEPE